MLLGLLGDIFKPIIGKFFPDPKDELKRLEMEQAFKLAIMNSEADITKAAAEVVKAEATSQSWLARNWRPITMLAFVVLIILRMLGLTSDKVTAAEYEALWAIVQIGIGGYVLGRSGEKIAEVFKK